MFSHWLQRDESLLQDQPETVNIACRRESYSTHVSAIPMTAVKRSEDAPAWMKPLKAHFAWWDYKIVHIEKTAGRSF
jgi:hypothetical protein